MGAGLEHEREGESPGGQTTVSKSLCDLMFMHNVTMRGGCCFQRGSALFCVGVVRYVGWCSALCREALEILIERSSARMY